MITERRCRVNSGFMFSTGQARGAVVVLLVLLLATGTLGSILLGRVGRLGFGSFKRRYKSNQEIVL